MDTAMHWGCMCAGRAGGCASSTPVRRATSALTTRPRLALKKSVSVVWRLKPALAPPRLVPELLRLVLKRNRQLVWRLKLALKKSAPVA